MNNCGKLNWKNIRKIIKYGLSKGLDYLKGFGDKFVGNNNIKDTIENLLNNFETLKEMGISDTIGDLGQDFIKNGYERGYNKIQDNLKDVDYGDIESKIENFKNKGKRIRNKTREYFDEPNDVEEIQETTNNSESTFGCDLKAPNYSKNGSNPISSEIKKSTDLISSEDIENNKLKWSMIDNIKLTHKEPLIVNTDLSIE